MDMDRPAPLVLKDMILHASQLGLAMPHQTIDAELAKDLASAGALAPSAGNDQPWKLLLHGGRLFLYHEAERSYSVLDPERMIPHIALGMFIENVLQRAGASGAQLEVHLAADVGPGPIAWFERVEGTPRPESCQWSDQLATRHTNRNPALGTELPSGTIAALQKALATTKDTRLLVVQDRDVLTRLGSISGAVEQIRFFDRQGHAEFFEREVRWTASEASRTRDGLDVRTLGLPLVGQWALRLAAKPWVMDLMRWSGSRALERPTADAVRTAAAVVLVTVPKLALPGRLMAGRAAQRVWLQATAMGVSVHPVSAAIFLGHLAELPPPSVLGDAETRKCRELLQELRSLFNAQEQQPAFMMKLTLAGATEVRSLRLPIEDILCTSDEG